MHLPCPLALSAALAFVLAPSLAAQPVLHTLQSPNGQTGGSFGADVAGVPDVDGDAVPDLLVGAYQESPGNSPTEAGRAYVFSGATGVLLYELRSPNEEPEGWFGSDVAGVPDVDGDGGGDLLVGAILENPGLSPPDAGRAYMFSGATGDLLYELLSPNSVERGYFGSGVSGVRDVDGDGRGDLLIGAYREGSETAGRAYVFSGATGDLLHTIASPSGDYFGFFGVRVSGVEDVDGDGRGDLVVGASFEDSGTTSAAGRAYVFSGASGAFLHTLDSPNPEGLGYFGTEVSGVPDVDSDENGDLLIGAPGEDGGAEGAGRAYLFSGATGAYLHTLETPNPWPLGGFGGSVSGVPDVDGDGRGDALVGAYHEEADANPGGIGRAYVFSGATGELLYEFDSPDDDEEGEFGHAVAGMPDADGDGRGDLLAGAPREAAFRGQAHFFSGSLKGVGVEGDALVWFALHPARPNPFGDRTTLSFVLPAPASVRLSVYDVLGREVSLLMEGTQRSGRHEVAFDGSWLPVGTYLVRLEAGGAVHSQRVTLVR